jgi:uncharacterized protein
MASVEATTRRPLLLQVVDFPLVALVIAVVLFIAATAIGSILGKYVPSLGQPGTAIVQNAITLALTLAVYKLVIVRLGERPKDDLTALGSLPDLGKGIALGAVLFSGVVGVAALLGVYRITGPGDSSTLLLHLVTAAIMPGIMEELLFRGILFRWLEAFAGSWAALVVTSALFGLAHIMNANATWFSSFAIAVEAGLLLGGAYMLTRNLWMAIGLHAAWNFTQGAVFGVPVSGHVVQGLIKSELSGPPLLSGGGFGLEASVIGLVIATGAGIWLVWLAVRRGELVKPWWACPKS